MILGAKYIANHIVKPNGDNIYALSVHPGAGKSSWTSCDFLADPNIKVNTDMQEQWKSAYPGM